MNAVLARAELSAEDRARADFYGLAAVLFHAAPDAQLLAAIARGEALPAAGAAELAAAWQALAAAAAEAQADAVREEYDSVFVGTGMAEVTPYASHYLAASRKEANLVRLRDELVAMGLARQSGAAEYEDHFAGLFEVMRHLIAAGLDDAAVQEQKVFFSNYLAPCYARFCAAVAASPQTNFYKYVARFTKAFLDVEAEAFSMV